MFEKSKTYIEISTYSLKVAVIDQEKCRIENHGAKSDQAKFLTNHESGCIVDYVRENYSRSHENFRFKGLMTSIDWLFRKWLFSRKLNFTQNNLAWK